jgi:hypothetical protein
MQVSISLKTAQVSRHQSIKVAESRSNVPEQYRQRLWSRSERAKENRKKKFFLSRARRMGNKQSNEQSETSYSYENISLTSLLSGDSKALATFEEQWLRGGFALLLLDGEHGVKLNGAADVAEQSLKVLFNGKDALHVDRANEESFGFGYALASHKESVRVMSGRGAKSNDEQFLSGFELLTDDVGAAMKSLADVSEQLAVDMATVIVPNLFDFERASSSSSSNESIVQQFGADNDLPLLRDGIGKGFLMLDAAHYFNVRAGTMAGRGSAPNRKLIDAGMNCVEHVDPGAFALSFLSTAGGLQVYDAVDKLWLDAPFIDRSPDAKPQPRVAVCWTGLAAAKASRGRIPACQHRVRYSHEYGRRLGMWFELCTAAQFSNTRNLFTRSPSDPPVTIPNVSGRHVRIGFSNGTDRRQRNVAPRNYESRTGMPMSKIVHLEPVHVPVAANEDGTKFVTSLNATGFEAELGMPISKSGIDLGPQFIDGDDDNGAADNSNNNIVTSLNAADFEAELGMPISKTGD